MHRFERYAIAQYVENLAARFGHRSKISGIGAEWLCSNGALLGIEVPDDDDEFKALATRHENRNAYRFIEKRQKFRGGVLRPSYAASM